MRFKHTDPVVLPLRCDSNGWLRLSMSRVAKTTAGVLAATMLAATPIAGAATGVGLLVGAGLIAAKVRNVRRVNELDGIMHTATGLLAEMPGRLVAKTHSVDDLVFKTRDVLERVHKTEVWTKLHEAALGGLAKTTTSWNLDLGGAVVSAMSMYRAPGSDWGPDQKHAMFLVLGVLLLSSFAWQRRKSAPDFHMVTTWNIGDASLKSVFPRSAHMEHDVAWLRKLCREGNSDLASHSHLSESADAQVAPIMETPLPTVAWGIDGLLQFEVDGHAYRAEKHGSEVRLFAGAGGEKPTVVFPTEAAFMRTWRLLLPLDLQSSSGPGL